MIKHHWTNGVQTSENFFKVQGNYRDKS